MARSSTSGQGRPKGALNRSTVDVLEKLKELNCDPIEGMAKIAMDEQSPLDIRSRMFSELAQYVAPKRKAMEHSGDLAIANLGVIQVPPKAPT